MIIVGNGIVDVSYSIDTTHGIIRISGIIDPNKLFTDIKRAGKHAELLHADIGAAVGGGSDGGGGEHSHSNIGYYYSNNNEHNVGYGNLVPSYNVQPQHGNYQCNGVLVPTSTALEPWHPPSSSQQCHLPTTYPQYYDTNNTCNIM